MSGRSIGTIIGGIIGAVLAPFTGGTSLMLAVSVGMTVGGMIGGLLDPEKGPHVEGPRLSDATQQTASYGSMIPRVYGALPMTGNVFWVENDKLKEVVTESSAGGKGMGGGATQTTYTYYGTFAVSLCEGPIKDIGRIWFSGKLWYNKGATDLDTIEVNKSRLKQFSVYYGDESQLPNPRIQADKGADNVPAYRGVAYIVFYDIDMTNYGNSLAGLQVKVEVVKDGAYSVLSEQLPTPANNQLDGGKATIVAGKYLFVTSGHWFYRYDVSEERKPVLNGSITTGRHKVSQLAYSKKNVFALASEVALVESIQGEQTVLIDNATTSLPSVGVAISATDDHLFVATSTELRIYETLWTGDLILLSTLSVTSISSVIGTISVSGTTLYLSRGVELITIDISDLYHPAILDSLTLPAVSQYYSAASYPLLYVATIAGVCVVDVTNPNNISLIRTVSITNNGCSISLVDGVMTVSYNLGATSTLAFYDVRKNPSDPDFIGSRTISLSRTGNITGQMSHKGVAYYVANSYSEAFTAGISAENFSLVYGDIVVSSGGIELGAIVKAECLKSNLLTDSDIDVTQLTQTVRGYMLTKVAAIRSGFDPIQAAFPFDVIQDGYKIKAVARGGSSVATVPYDKLAATAGDSSKEIKLTNSREMASVLPAKVNVNFFDYNREGDIGQQVYERINTDAVNTTNLELPIMLTPSEAYGKAQTLCYLYWLERYDVSIKLPPEYLNLQPADVITVSGPGETYELRIKQINYTVNNILEIQAKLNAPGIYTPTTVTDGGQVAVNTLAPKGKTVFNLVDCPTLSDSFDKAGYILAMSGTRNGWPGGILLRSDDGGGSFSTVTAMTKPGTVIGTALNAIGADKGQVINTSNELIVSLNSGELSSVTEAAMLNGANHFAYGAAGRWEIIASKNCALQSDGTYKLSGLIRGRLGTEQYTGSHVTGDSVVALSTTGVRFISSSTNLIGQERIFRGVNSGAALSTGADTPFTYHGVNLKPLSPVFAKGSVSTATGDWSIAWTRRTRLGHEWRDFVDASLGEASESYDIEVYSDVTYSTVKRTLTSSTPSVVYPLSQQLVDFGSTPGDPNYILRSVGLHLDGADNSTVILDASPVPKTITAYGDAKIKTSQSVFGGSSCFFDGTGDHLGASVDNAFGMGTGDFTLMLRIYPTATTGGDRALVDFRSSFTANNGVFFIDNPSGGKLAFYDGTTKFGATGAVIPLNTWTAVALVRSGSILTCFVNGAVDFSVTMSTDLGSSKPLGIGGSRVTGSEGSSPFAGYIDEVLIYKGVAVHTSAYTPESSAMLDIPDGVSSTINLKIYQISHSVGRGYPLKVTLTA